MTRLSTVLSLFLAPLLFASTAFASRTAGENVDDATLGAQAKAALVDDRHVAAGHINIEVRRGVVQLGGFVDTELEKTSAVAAVRRIHGVGSVQDAMVVLPGTRSLGQTLDDTKIQTQLKARLADIEGLAAAQRINTEVRQGHVLLSGFVGHDSQRTQAGSIARGINGVKAVHNKISVAR